MKTRDFRGGLFPVDGRPRPIEPKEQFISKSIQAYLDARNVYNDRLNSGRVQVIKRYRASDGQWRERRNWMQLCKKGTPDRFFVLGLRMYMVEVKIRGKLPTPEQVAMHKFLKDKGIPVIVADSLDSFIQQFRALLLPGS